MKKVLIFLGGLVTGVLLTLLISWAIVSNQAETEADDVIKMFDEPGEVIETQSFKVFQAITEGAALAHAEDDGLYMGVTCLLKDDEGKYYYDQEIVEIPEGKVAKQVGIFRYETAAGLSTTVPIVKIMNK